MAKNRQRNAKKKARYRQQRRSWRSQERFAADEAPIEDLRIRWVKRVLSELGVPHDRLRQLDSERERLGLSWDGLTDHLVMKLVPEALERAVQTYSDFSALGLQARPSDVGIVLHREETEYAVIYPTHALVVGGTRHHAVRGNFTADGTHWSKLRAALLEPCPDRADRVVGASRVAMEGGAEPRRLVVTFPSCMEGGLRARALVASRRIRTERCRDYGSHPVVLEARDHTVRYEAISRRSGAVELPFTFAREGEGAIRGALRLQCASDPLGFVCAPDLDDSLLALAWGIGLIGFAELTCLSEVQRLGGSDARRGKRQDPRTSMRVRYLPSDALSDPSSSLLHPTPKTAELLASHVAGHRRRLSDTAHPGEEARAAAAEIGIVLSPHETWVRSHVRGAPGDAELHFRWAPSPIALVA